MFNHTRIGHPGDMQPGPRTARDGANAITTYEEFPPELVPVNAVRIHGGTQPRTGIDRAVVAEYAEALRAGATLPPAMLFFDGTEFWLADGFHRYHACVANGCALLAIIRTGGRRDAVLYAVGANANHGLRRTNEDKRRAVSMLLQDQEWATWSDREIARTCCVSHNFVSEERKTISHRMTDTAAGTATVIGNPDDAMLVSRTVKRNGKTYRQNVAKIGKGKDKVTPAMLSGSVSSIQAGMTFVGPALLLRGDAVDMAELAALREENAELRLLLDQTLANNDAMGRVCEADDRLQAAMIEVECQRLIAQNSVSATIYWKTRAERAEKLLAKADATLWRSGAVKELLTEID